MTIPNTNISFSSIWGEANSGSPTDIGLYGIGFYSYFSGPNGSSVVTDNNWGQGQFSGADIIYNLNATTTDFKVSDFADLDYFYDQVNYQCILNVTNNLPTPPPPPSPPNTNDIQDVEIFLRDNTNTYPYINTGIGPVSFGGGNTTTDVSSITSPLINVGYWTLTITPSASFPASTADLTINGITIFTGVGVNAGPSQTTFDFTTYGAVNMGIITGGVIGFEFILTIT
jgi:hypothetical protein